ncbi:stress responsive protein [Paenibacillus oryzae]|uniref:Stress responsive protein n=1 Tax=Paenibacillus oryzae TaxID=1844972 RepID=A0A1A5YP88_9BACL|nr:Dabb family protein [Paenibacillus oryzae]OBR67373.1 stress responsive protein [Paenibacillus oryzae]
MITHIVFFKLKDRSKASVDATAAVLRNLEGKIDVLRYIEVGTDVLHSERSYDIALVTRFDSLADLDAYQVHPEHKKVIEHMSQVRESSVSVDYES